MTTQKAKRGIADPPMVAGDAGMQQVLQEASATYSSFQWSNGNISVQGGAAKRSGLPGSRFI